MNIIDESFKENKDDKNKSNKRARSIVLAFIIIILIAIIAIVIAMAYLKEEPLIISIDGNVIDKVSKETQTTNKTIGQLIRFESDGTIYIPIKKMADYIDGYEAFSGEYSNKSEETNACYVECQDEIIEMKLNSKRVYKTGLTQGNLDYEYYDIKKPIKAFDGELYISSDGMEKVFNTTFSYNETNKKVAMYTLPYLVENYTNTALEYGYEKIDKNIVNQKAIFNNLLVVSKNSEKVFGVIDIEKGSTILEAKYSSIKYLPSIGDFIVTDNDKKGVISSNKERKVEVKYDNIELIDKDAGIYIVKKENKYGVVDLKGGAVVNVEYDEIGIDKNKFKENGIKNQYLLVENLIPARKDKLWGLFDKKGNLVVDFQYDSFGYIASNNKSALNLLIIPDYNVIVTCKDKRYGLINSSGQEIFSTIVDDLYMIYEGGKYKYYMHQGENKWDVEEYLKQKGVPQTSNTATNNTTTTDNNTNNSTNQTSNNNQENNTENNTEN